MQRIKSLKSAVYFALYLGFFVIRSLKLKNAWQLLPNDEDESGGGVVGAESDCHAPFQRGAKAVEIQSRAKKAAGGAGASLSTSSPPFAFLRHPFLRRPPFTAAPFPCPLF